MDAAPASSLERILSRRSLVRGHARAAAVWSILAAVLLVLLLLDLGLLIGLLVDRGQVDLFLDPDEAARFAKLTDLPVTETPVDSQAVGADADTARTIHVFFDEHGILPAVWRMRDNWWGPFVAYLYRHLGWLQMNLLGLISLLSIGVVLFLLRSVALTQVRSNSHRVALDGVTAARRQLHRQVLRLGPEDLDGTGHETATDLFVTEVEKIRSGLFEFITTMSRYPLELLALSLVILSIDWRLALQWVAPLTLGLLLLDGIRKGALKKQELVEDRCKDEQQVLLSSFKNARLTRGLGIEQSEHEQFQKHLERYHSQISYLNRAADAVDHPAIGVVLACAVVLSFLVFLVCSNILLSKSSSAAGGITIAEGLTFVTAIGLTIPAIRSLRALPDIRRQLRFAADKIQRFLNLVPAVSQAVGAKFLQPLSKTLHFENVKYQTAAGRKILDGVDFKLEVDKCYGIVSLDPLEAKAVALMLPRFLEPREGRVLIDGEDVAWVTLESLRAETVFVAADDPSFDGTVFENIRGGQTDLTLQEVTEAAKITHAHNFIVKLFNGYETVLTSQVDSLDAGQRFRLGLARAIVRNPALLIIEEPWEALDEDTKTLLVDAYDRICRERTVIFLPSRMSTIRRTDQIVVLHEGKVVAFGPHSKLVTQSPVYRHWEYLNFNEYRRGT